MQAKKEKGNIFFTETSNSMFLKGKSRIHIETDAQEIKLYFVAESLSSELLMHGVPETTQNGRAWALFQGPLRNSGHWSLRPAATSVRAWVTPPRKVPGFQSVRVSWELPKMSPVEPRDTRQWRPGAGKSRIGREQQPRAREDGLFPHGLLWRLPVWGSWSVGDLVSLLKM